MGKRSRGINAFGLSKVIGKTYKVLRILNWVNAILRGPGAILRRFVRVFVGRRMARILRKL